MRNIKNFFALNELTQRKNTNGAFVLIGAAKSYTGDLIIVRSVVNNFALDDISVLYAVNAKKESAATVSPGFTNNSLSATDSYIGILNLLDYDEDNYSNSNTLKPNSTFSRLYEDSFLRENRRRIKEKEYDVSNMISNMINNAEEISTFNDIEKIFDKYDYENKFFSYKKPIRNHSFFKRDNDHSNLNIQPLALDNTLSSINTTSVPKEIDRSYYSNLTPQIYQKKKSERIIRHISQIPNMQSNFNSISPSNYELQVRESKDNISNLNKSIQHLKDQIEKEISPISTPIVHRQKNSSKTFSPISTLKLSDKLTKLTQIIFCLFRTISSEANKVNPFKVMSTNELIQNYGFAKGTIALNKALGEIMISSSGQIKPPLKIGVKNIESTLIHSSIKKITEILRILKKYKINNEQDLNAYLDSKFFVNSGYSKDEFYLAFQNKIFNFTILCKNQMRV